MKIRYENFTNHPQVRKMCLSCDKADCDGVCDDLRNLIRDILGYPHLQERKKAEPKEPYRIRKQYEKRTYKHCKQHVINGVSHTLVEWAKISGVDYNTLYMRMYRHGMPLSEAMGEPWAPITSCRATITVNGERLLIKEWAKRLGVQPSCIYSRMRRGHTPEEAVTMPKKKSRWE